MPIPAPLHYCPLVLAKIWDDGVALIYKYLLLVNQAPCFNMFFCAQKIRKLIGIIS